MIRACIVNTQSNLVENIIDYENLPAGTPPGFAGSYIAVASAAGQIGWNYNNGTLAAPEPAALAPEQICDQVDSIRDARLAAGFTDAVTGKIWACDDSSIGRWTAMAASAQPFALGIAPNGLPAPTYQPIPTDNSIPYAMSAADVYALFEGRVMPWVSATIIYGRMMKNNILAGNPPADITQGWP